MMRNSFYTIIPHLVSVETNVPVLNDFLLAQNLSFYPASGKLPYHYTILFTNRFSFSLDNAYRIGNYFVNNKSIFYHRPFISNIGFRFVYHYKTKTFICNEFYRFHFVNIGDIFTIGRHLFHTIESDLAMHGYFLLLGAAVGKNKKTVVLLAPNANGKTTFVNKALDAGYKYIAENYLVIHPKTNVIYGTGPILFNKGRFSNSVLANKLNNGDLPFDPVGLFRNAYLLWPKKKEYDMKRIIANYVYTYSAYYKKNNLVRSLLYYHSKNVLVDLKYSSLITYLYKKIRIIHNASDISL